jgi:ABC-type glutathione transport system ATPase component
MDCLLGVRRLTVSFRKVDKTKFSAISEINFRIAGEHVLDLLGESDSVGRRMLLRYTHLVQYGLRAANTA